MTGLMTLCVSLISIFISIGWLWIGSRNALDYYKSDVKKGNDPKPDDFSLSFSFGAAYGILFMGFIMPVFQLLESVGFSTEMLVERYPWWFTGISLILFIILVTACEWLLRKMAWYYQPNICFEKWWFLDRYKGEKLCQE
ncbi:MAG: hypothetical protein WCV41_04215 [Patescibacteria group bacterium]|jgi:hypothetical protein